MSFVEEGATQRLQTPHLPLSRFVLPATANITNAVFTFFLLSPFNNCTTPTLPSTFQPAKCVAYTSAFARPRQIHQSRVLWILPWSAACAAAGLIISVGSRRDSDLGSFHSGRRSSPSVAILSPHSRLRMQPLAACCAGMARPGGFATASSRATMARKCLSCWPEPRVPRRTRLRMESSMCFALLKVLFLSSFFTRLPTRSTTEGIAWAGDL